MDAYMGSHNIINEMILEGYSVEETSKPPSRRTAYSRYS